jgi:hypothetical protein
MNMCLQNDINVIRILQTNVGVIKIIGIYN